MVLRRTFLKNEARWVRAARWSSDTNLVADTSQSATAKDAHVRRSSRFFRGEVEFASGSIGTKTSVYQALLPNDS